MVMKLMELGVDVWAVDRDGKTALEYVDVHDVDEGTVKLRKYLRNAMNEIDQNPARFKRAVKPVIRYQGQHALLESYP